MLPKSINLTDYSASECSDIGLMSEVCDVFGAKCEEHHICRKIARMRSVFFEELVLDMTVLTSTF